MFTLALYSCLAEESVSIGIKKNKVMDTILMNIKMERFFFLLKAEKNWKNNVGNKNEGTFIGTIIDTEKGEVFVPANKTNKAENK